MSPAEIYLSTLAPSTRRVMAGDLRAAAGIAFPAPQEPAWETLTPEQGSALRVAVAARWAPGTANRVLAAVRGVVRASWRAGLTPFDSQVRLLACLTRVRGGRVTRGRSLDFPQVTRLIEAGSGYEERALLAVLAGCGLRRAEASALTWDRLTRHDQAWHARVIGKGNKERRVRVPHWAALRVDAWRRQQDAYTLDPASRVFRWTPDAIHDRVTRAALRAGLGHVAPHDLRRTYYALARASGLDIRTIQRTMGHADIQTTARYDRRSDDDVLAETACMDNLEAE